MVSISLTEKNIRTLEEIQGELGLSGRSEAVRACLRSAEADLREREDLDGEVEGVIVIVHSSHTSPRLDEVRHRFQDQVTTQIHSHLRNQKCLEVFLVRADSSSVKEMLDILHSEDHFEYVKFVRS